MVDTSTPVKDGNGTLVQVDVATQSNNDVRQIVVPGDAVDNYTQKFRSTGEAVVGFTSISASGSITATDSVNTGTITVNMAGPSGNVGVLTTPNAGTPTAGSTIGMALDGQSLCTIAVTGTHAFSMYVEVSADGGANWFVSAPAIITHLANTRPPILSNGTITSGSRGTLQLNVAGMTNVRVRAVAGSGTAVIRMNASCAIGTVPAEIINPVTAAVATASNNSSVAASVTSVTLAAAGARTGVSITNDSTTATLYLIWGATASLTSYTAKVAPGYLYETSVYNGVIAGIWDAAVGSARVSIANT